MFEIVFYEDENKKSDLFDYLEDLRLKSASSKHSRIEYNQILLYIDILSRVGTRSNSNIVKFLRNKIWELRPGSNRILFFHCSNDAFVLLSHFRKSTIKTPKSEFAKAEDRMNDWRFRNENME